MNKKDAGYLITILTMILGSGISQGAAAINSKLKQVEENKVKNEAQDQQIIALKESLDKSFDKLSVSLNGMTTELKELRKELKKSEIDINTLKTIQKQLDRQQRGKK